MEFSIFWIWGDLRRFSWKSTFFEEIRGDLRRNFKFEEIWGGVATLNVRDSQWWGTLAMIPAGNKAKRFSPVNHTTKTIHLSNKKVTSTSYGSSTSSWKPWRWVKLDLIFRMRGYTHQFQTGPTHKTQYKQQKRQAKRYSSTEHLSNDHNDRPNQHENSHKLYDEKGIAFPDWSGVNENRDNKMIRTAQRRESHGIKNTSDRINKSERARLWKSQ